MPEVTGTIRKVERKQASNGGTYAAVHLRGHRKPFYDWDGYCELAFAAQGDRVRVEHDGSDFPRVTAVQKLAPDTEQEPGEDARDRQITRMCSLKCAAWVLQTSDLPYEERVNEITALAGKLEQWIKG